MATSAAVKEAITCCICIDVYRDPHALPCLHTLCKPCIDQLAVRGRVECPECREISKVRKIRKDFKIQSLIDAYNGTGEESAYGESGFEEVCGMCREPAKVVSCHCKECEYFMCVDCEKAHKAIKVCRGHTVMTVKDIVQIAQSKLEACVNQWKTEKNKITTKANTIKLSITIVQCEEKKQIELTNKHFDNLISHLEKKRIALVKEITEANEDSVQSLRTNNGLYDQLRTEIQSKIDVLLKVMKGKHASTMNDMVDDMEGSLKEQVIELRNQVDSFDSCSVVPFKVHIDEIVNGIDTRIKLEKMPPCDIGTFERSLTLCGDYSKLKSTKYQLISSQSGSAIILRICIIQNNLWCAAWNDGIQIYNKNMQLIKKIEHQDYKCVTGLAEWRGEMIIVACVDARGLHQITQAGDYVQKITDNSFTDVCSNDTYVYGLQSNKPQKILIFTHEKNIWSQTSEIPLKTDNMSLYDVLIVNANSLFISLCEDNTIQKYSLEGKLQQTFGRGGTLTGGLNGPILSGVDVHDNLLVADKGNKQLKVYYSEEQAWQVVPVKLDSELYGAVMDENNIWVLPGHLSCTILKFTKKLVQY